MEYITGDKDTFESIAASVAGDPSFAETIAASNGMYSDVLQVPLNVVLEPGLALHIPDSIVGRGVRIDVIGGQLGKWLDFKQIATLAVAGIIVAWLTSSRHRR